MNETKTETKAKRVVCPKLVDIATGKARVTNMQYLTAKAERLQTTVENIVKNYVSKETLKALRAGETFGLEQKVINRVLKFNGKAPKAKAEKAPKAEPVAA